MTAFEELIAQQSIDKMENNVLIKETNDFIRFFVNNHPEGKIEQD